MFARNLTSLRKSRNTTQEDIARAIGVNRSTYAGYENGKSEPTVSVILKMAAYFQVSVDTMLYGAVEPPPLFRQPSVCQPALLRDARVLAITVNEEEKENIQYVPFAAVAGYASEFNQAEFIEQLPHFRLPKLGQGTYRAFDVQGDSMPPIHDGYIIIGRFMEHANSLRDGSRYVLVTKNAGVVFKRVTRDSSKASRFILTSDNPAFAPYTLDLAEVLEAWEMAAFVGFPSVYQDSFPLLNERLQNIEQKVDRLTSQS